MRKLIWMAVLVSISKMTPAQKTLDSLTVEKIMRDPAWMGSSPSQPVWNMGGDTLYFLWNPNHQQADSVYYITLKNKTPQKARPELQYSRPTQRGYSFNLAGNRYVFEKNGDIFFTDIPRGQTKRITYTIENESHPCFSFSDQKIVYEKSGNLYAWDISSGETRQLTNIGGAENNISSPERKGLEERWLQQDQLFQFDILRERRARADSQTAYRNAIPKEKPLRHIPIKEGRVNRLTISPDGRYVHYQITKSSSAKNTIVPQYVTETGYTSLIPSRSKVGAEPYTSVFYTFDRERDTIFSLPTDSIPGIRELPDYLQDYPQLFEKAKAANAPRPITVQAISWSPEGSHAVIEIRSNDNKDRWLMRWLPEENKLLLLDHQRDEAWIGGPGIHSGATGWIDENTFWFQSEATGYSHLYTIDVGTLKRQTLTQGRYEVQEARLSDDKKYFYITTNEVHPGEKHFYRLHIATGRQEKLTSMAGANNVVLSPNEKNIAILHSYSNRPWELYLQENKSGAKAIPITFAAQSEEFRSYPWRDPELVNFTATDGAQVYARVYKPEHPHPNKPAILFVHGAGYLQNAHRWWSSYFREYMFNNMLADNGYYVMDIDYRGSAGYGRNWRTGIYRHMGGKDLDDHIDAIQYLVNQYGINPNHVGLYGGSYGGFITLMALFKYPDQFRAGAALRPVTDWANYNHGYTSNILNEPYNDSLAYYRSSPLYFANGLKGDLLICHGMADVNVHFQDAVKLSQKLIELGKNNWELAGYPMEDHGFTEPSSWTDEYKRIFKLFERTLKKD